MIDKNSEIIKVLINRINEAPKASFNVDLLDCVLEELKKIVS